MKNINLFISTFSLIIIMVLASASVAYAGTYECQSYGSTSYGGYGGCVTPQYTVAVNKTVRNPQTGQFVDNLGINDPKHKPEGIVAYQITVTNIGNTTLSQVVVKDVFPSFVTFVSGPGAYDSKTNTLSMLVRDLTPGESETVTITGRVAKQAALPQNNGMVCDVVNKATATVNNTMVEDNAALCIEKPVLSTKGGLKIYGKPEVKSTPKTGPELMALMGLIPTMLSGLYLRKKAI